MSLLSSRTVSDALLDVLADAGATTPYGIPGDAINSLVEAVRKQDRIRFVQVRHEEVGALAASAEDGSMAMSMSDLVTATKYELAVTLVVLNNGKLGLIQMEQEVQGYAEFQTHLRNPDFAAVAEACRVKGWTVFDPSQLESTLRAAIEADQPTLVDVVVEPEERTMPPRIRAPQAFGYGMAKAKEFFGMGDKEGGREVIDSALPR